MNQEQEISTRKVILTLLKTQGSLSVSDLSRRLGITEMAVRRHLNTLEKDGFISSTLVRQAMGRPAHMYALTEHADHLFPKKYHDLILELLQDLEELSGEKLVTQLFEKRKERMLHDYVPQIVGETLAERLAELVEIQNAHGYMANWEAEDGEYTLQEHNCPIAQVANRFNHACQCELTLFRTLLRADVEQTDCLAKGGASCCYKIKATSASDQ